MAWGDIGASRNSSSGASDLVQLEDGKVLRLMLPPEGPVSNWNYSISAPDDGYRTWVAPPKGAEDFFAKNSQAFRMKPVHAGLAYDYEEKAIKILEAGNQIWEDIQKLHAAGKDLNGRDIVIGKKGTGRQTTYSVVDKDPAPFTIDVSGMEKPDINARYQVPTYEQVLEDLKAMGFTQPEQLFQTAPLSYEQAIATKVPFGKNKDKTLQEVYNTDSQYLLFLATKIDRRDIKEAARVVCNKLMGTAYELDGIAPSVDQVAFVAPEKADGGQQQQTGTQTPPPPAPPAGTGPQRPTNPSFIHTNPDGSEMWWDGAAWIDAPKAPPAPPAPPTPPVAPPPAGGGFNRQTAIDEINGIFESEAKYKDFTLIINVMKEASAPHGKTSIADFTDGELQNLLSKIK